MKKIIQTVETMSLQVLSKIYIEYGFAFKHWKKCFSWIYIQQMLLSYSPFCITDTKCNYSPSSKADIPLSNGHKHHQPYNINISEYLPVPVPHVTVYIPASSLYMLPPAVPASLSSHQAAF